MLKLIRDSNMPSKKSANSGKHHTSDNSSATALKRKIHTRVGVNKKNTLFGLYNNKSRDGSVVAQKPANRGDQGTYLYFKHIFPMPIKSVTKQ